MLNSKITSIDLNSSVRPGTLTIEDGVNMLADDANGKVGSEARIDYSSGVINFELVTDERKLTARWIKY